MKKKSYVDHNNSVLCIELENKYLDDGKTLSFQTSVGAPESTVKRSQRFAGASTKWISIRGRKPGRPFKTPGLTDMNRGLGDDGAVQPPLLPRYKFRNE